MRIRSRSESVVESGRNRSRLGCGLFRRWSQSPLPSLRFYFASARCESNLFDCVNCIESSETPTVHSHLLISKAWTSVSIATYLMFRPPLKISSLSSPYLSFTDVQLGSHAAFYVPVNPFLDLVLVYVSHDPPAWTPLWLLNVTWGWLLFNNWPYACDIFSLIMIW